MLGGALEANIHWSNPAYLRLFPKEEFKFYGYILSIGIGAAMITNLLNNNNVTVTGLM